MDYQDKVSGWLQTQQFKKYRRLFESSPVNDTLSKISSLNDSVSISRNETKHHTKKLKQSTKTQESKESKEAQLRDDEEIADSSFWTSLDDIKYSMRTDEHLWKRQSSIPIVPSVKDYCHEIYSLFEKNLVINSPVNLSESYTIDWNRYAQANMQYLIWSKRCNKDSYEFRKELDYCPSCKDDSFEIILRFNLPLDLSHLKSPENRSYCVFAAIVYQELLFNSTKPFLKYSYIRKMYKVYQQCAMENKGTITKKKIQLSNDYQEWFRLTCRYIRRTLKDRRIILKSGNLIRRKTSNSAEISKLQCLIFANNIEIVKNF